MDWIPIEDNLPQGTWTKNEWQKHLSQDVLFHNGMHHYIGRWNRQELEWETDEPASRNTVWEVTHWMELPEIKRIRN